MCYIYIWYIRLRPRSRVFPSIVKRLAVYRKMVVGGRRPAAGIPKPPPAVPARTRITVKSPEKPVKTKELLATPPPKGRSGALKLKSSMKLLPPPPPPPAPPLTRPKLMPPPPCPKLVKKHVSFSRPTAMKASPPKKLKQTKLMSPFQRVMVTFPIYRAPRTPQTNAKPSKCSAKPSQVRFVKIATL